MRKIIALTAAAGLLVTLAACSTGAPSGTCTPTADPGDGSNAVTAAGAFGKDPAAKFPTPLIASGLESSVTSQGDGATVYPGQYAIAQVTLYEGLSGEKLVSTSYDESEGFLVRAGEGASKLSKAITCAEVGSRVSVAAHGSDLYGFAGINEQTFKADETVVVVFDIQDSALGKAYGAIQIAQQGMPSVVTTPDGQPGVTVPSEEPPTGLRFNVLQQGDGTAIKAGDTIYAHYLRVDWSNPKSSGSTKSTWDDFGDPEEMTLVDLDPATGAGLTTGLLQALTGQKVGSQILVVVPPSFGFPDGFTPPDGIDAGATLVYVVDILGVKK